MRRNNNHDWPCAIKFMGGAQFRRQRLAINDPQVPIATTTDERQGEPRWLLVITVLFAIGVLLLLIFYARLPEFLS
jgi:hypothetical protein